jgi:general secretion pathway protein K
MKKTQRGAALLLAMIAVSLIATLAATMVWQQHRAIQVEAAERARTQAGWILIGALDWSRLILREDARSGSIDHGGEPWATPLAEARLSTFLAADASGTVTDADGVEAFLSGTIVDAQSRFNLRNLVGEDGKLQPAELATLERLCASSGLPSDTARRIGAALALSWSVKSEVDTAATASAGRPLPVHRFEQLLWLGLEPGILAALRPSADILPFATPVNLNTAPREVLAAVLGIDLGAAERLVQRRQRTPFESLEQVTPHLPEGVRVDPKRMAVASQHFEVAGRLRLDDRVLEERSLVLRRGSGSNSEVVTLRRERRSLLGEGS